MKIKPNAKKYLFSAAAALALIGGTVGIASAHMGMGGGKSSAEFAKAIATRFNLNQPDVETFLTQQQTARMEQMHAQMKTKIEARLTQAVASGKITEQQKQLIITKGAEVEQKIIALAAVTDKTARQAAMKAIQADLNGWATQNNIPTNFIQGAGPLKGFGGFGHAGVKGMKDKAPKTN